MSRTDEIIAAAKMPPEAVKMSRYIDAVYFPILCILLVGTYHMHFMLLAGDWDFWLDWKDRQWWPVVTPIVGIMYCAALMYCRDDIFQHEKINPINCKSSGFPLMI